MVLTEIHQVLEQAGISMSVGRLTTFFDDDKRLSTLALEHKKFFDNDLHGPLENCFRVIFNVY